MRRLLFLLVAALLMTACGTLAEDAPPGKYVAYPDGHDVNPTIISAFGYTIELQADPPTHQPQPTYTPYPTQTQRPTYTPYPTYTPGSDVGPTQETGIALTFDPGTNKCELRILNVNHNLRNGHSTSSTIIINIERLNYVEGLSFWYSDANEEWARVSFNGYTGWIRVDSNVEYDPLGPCIDLPSEFEAPLPTIQPTFPATPAPTVQPGGQCQVFNPYAASTIRIRETYVVTSSNVVGALAVGATATVGHIYTKTPGIEQWAFITTGGANPVTGWVATLLDGGSVALLQGDCSEVKTGPVRSVYPFGTGPKVFSQGSTLPGPFVQS